MQFCKHSLINCFYSAGLVVSYLVIHEYNMLAKAVVLANVCFVMLALLVCFYQSQTNAKCF